VLARIALRTPRDLPDDVGVVGNARIERACLLRPPSPAWDDDHGIRTRVTR
jgi:hypothetical protein